MTGLKLDAIKEIIKGILKHPESRVCKHHIVCLICEALEDEKVVEVDDVFKAFVGLVVDCDDKNALEYLDLVKVRRQGSFDWKVGDYVWVPSGGYGKITRDEGDGWYVVIRS